MSTAPVVSIELLLDSAAEDAVRTEWEALAAAGLSSLARHPGDSNRPHVTLLVRDTLSELDTTPAVSAGPFAVTLGAPVLFGAGERRVLARSVVPSAELLALHTAVHAAAGPGTDAPHTAPGTWTPHVTLARRIRTEDLARALAAVAGDIHGRAAALRRWDAATKTVSELGRF